MQKQFFFWLKTILIFAAIFIAIVLSITVYAFLNSELGIGTVLIVSAISLFIVIISVFLAKYYFSMMENFSVSDESICFTGHKKSGKRSIADCKKIIVKQGRCQCCFIFSDGSKILCQYKYFPIQADKLSYDLITKTNFPGADIVFE